MLVAAAVVFPTWLWQFLTVRYNYDGNWSALFCIAQRMPVPDFLRGEHLYIFQNSDGYDGQVYHLIAHDPWMRRGSADAILSPRFRYQRILVPALAWLVALGRDEWIHRAYFGLVLAFVFAGTYWTSRLAAVMKRTPHWGFAFLLMPATIISIDRMTVDVATAALLIGFALYLETGPWWKVALTLAAIGLTRETGVFMIAGFIVFLLAKREFVRAAMSSLTAAPAIGWFIWLARQRPERSPLAIALNPVPLRGIVEDLRHPFSYQLRPAVDRVVIFMDDVALAGVVLLLLIVAGLALRRHWNAKAGMMYILAAPTPFVRAPEWTDAFGFGRALTPLMFLAADANLQRRPWLALAPFAMIDARVVLNLVPQVLGVASGLTGLDMRSLVKY
jgi:hypothetical protein